MGFTVGSQGVRAEMNVTPMIDLLLVLIILFMIITPNKSRGLEAAVPAPAPTEASDPRPLDIIVTVQADQSVRINQEPVRWEDLPQRMAVIYARRANGIVFIRGSGGLEFQHVARVIDIAKGAGAARVALMTTPVDRE